MEFCTITDDIVKGLKNRIPGKIWNFVFHFLLVAEIKIKKLMSSRISGFFDGSIIKRYELLYSL
jgi:hypothetical protein